MAKDRSQWGGFCEHGNEASVLLVSWSATQSVNEECAAFS